MVGIIITVGIGTADGTGITAGAVIATGIAATGIDGCCSLDAADFTGIG